MQIFRLILIAFLVTVAIYTAITISNHGWDLLPVFFGDIARMNWPGQFNMDFMCFLLLSGMWVAWRHEFNAVGLALGIVAVFGGMPFLATYLLIHSTRTGGDMAALLLGTNRARRIIGR